MKKVKVIANCIECGKKFEVGATTQSKLKTENKIDIIATVAMCECGKLNILQIDDDISRGHLSVLKEILKKISNDIVDSKRPQNGLKERYKIYSKKLNARRTYLKRNFNQQLTTYIEVTDNEN